MKTTKADHEPAATPHPPITAGESPGPFADPQVGSFVIPIPGLVFDSPPGGVRRRSAPNDPLGGTALSPDIADRLTSRRGRGEPLPPDVAQSMGDAMGADLTGVRIHTGPEPAELARSVQAVAFTQGADIYFGAGTTPRGRRPGSDCWPTSWRTPCKQSSWHVRWQGLRWWSDHRPRRRPRRGRGGPDRRRCAERPATTGGRPTRRWATPTIPANRFGGPSRWRCSGLAHHVDASRPEPAGFRRPGRRSPHCTASSTCGGCLLPSPPQRRPP